MADLTAQQREAQDAIDSGTASWAQRLKDYIKDAEPLESETYLPPNEEPLDWKDAGKVVTLDAAIFAMHLLAARVALESFPSVLIEGLKKIASLFESLAARTAAKKLSGVLPRANLYTAAANEFLKVFVASKIQRATEGNIRFASLTVQKDLRRLALERNHRKHTRLVSTRHPSGPQRAKNKSWHPRK